MSETNIRHSKKAVLIIAILIGLAIFIVITVIGSNYTNPVVDNSSSIVDVYGNSSDSQNDSDSASSDEESFVSEDINMSETSDSSDESSDFSSKEVSEETSADISELSESYDSSEETTQSNEMSDDISEESEPSYTSEVSEPQVIRYTVKYHANGGIGSMSSTSFEYGESKTLATNTFARTGYQFQGWSTTPSGSVIYLDKATVKNLSSTNNAVITLYAVWQPITYTVKYNSNGGSGTMSNTSFAYNESKALAANTYTRTGYHVFGKYKSEQCGT